MVRKIRWKNGIVCPYCGSKEISKYGRSSKKSQRYKCKNCEKLFNDLTNTVVTIVVRRTKEVCFKVFENLTKFSEKFKDNFEKLINGSIKVYTNEYNIYNNLHERLGNIIYEHEIVNHSKREYARGDVHDNTCENRHGFLRSYIGKYRGVSFKWLQGYLDLLALKLNRRYTWLSMILSTDI